jgi:hypothetical protein
MPDNHDPPRIVEARTQSGHPCCGALDRFEDRVDDEGEAEPGPGLDQNLAASVLVVDISAVAEVRAYTVETHIDGHEAQPGARGTSA